MRIKVNVTPDVLERSKMCGFNQSALLVNRNCAVAVALIDLFPDAIVECDFANLMPDDPKMSLTTLRLQPDFVELPEMVKLFILNFDSSSPQERVLMQPFSFEIEVPEYVISKIGLGEIYRVLSESKSLELVIPKETTYDFDDDENYNV